MKINETFQELTVKTLTESITASFDFDPKKFLIKNVCKNPYVNCVTKVTGTVRNNEIPLNFIAIVKFNVTLEESGLSAQLTNINVCDITLVGKYDDAPTSCGDFKLYYNINKIDSCDSSEIIDDKNELIIYKVIEDAFNESVVTFLPDKIIVNLIFQTDSDPKLSYIIGGVNIGSNDPCNKQFNKYSITGCHCKPHAPIFPYFHCNKISIMLLKTLIISIIFCVIDPACHYLPSWVCKVKKYIRQSLTLSIK
jgi:hypothetical protein